MTTNRALLDLDAIPGMFSHHVATSADLIALGLSGSTIEERCRDGGPWRRLQSGIVLLGDTPPSRAQRIQAALTVAGPEAVLTGVDALALHGLSGARLDGPVHVLVSPRRQSRLVDGVFFDRTNTPPVAQLRSGFPVAPLPRATIDTCRRAPSAEHVRALLTSVIREARVSPATLREELTRATSRGTALPRRILAELDDGVRSLAQGWARRLVLRAGLPTPRWRVPISGPSGAHLATPDAWWDVGLAWEVDSYAFDLTPADYAAALTRATHLTAAGILVVHTRPAQLRDEPAAVADLLTSAYTQASTRPRPDVEAA
ncbi:MAG: hypothetical protein ACRDSK_02715 [Actinophytocola sp.]|uniref:hypothetical protein n=1 Tax=Actinophytocola sp. TaxID=1872138 RepID=UPI003D6BD8D2